MNRNALLEESLSALQCIISIMGDHAGEGVATIFERKIEDITKCEVTFWLIKSPKAKPDLVQKMCRANPVYVLFVEPATKGGARPTVAAKKVTEFSEDGVAWNKLPPGLGHVTGNLNSCAYALVFDELQVLDESRKVDLWNYADFDNPERPVKTILGCSTICATKKKMANHPEKLKSRYRRIIAVARLIKPYCVWVK